MRRRLVDERGSALVEFALVAPVLLLFLLGIIQIGLYLFTMDDVSQATRQGGRLLTTLRGDSNGVQEVESKIASSVGSEVNPSALTYSFSSPAPWTHATSVTVTVTYPEALSVMGITISPGPIKATTVVDVE